MAAAYVEGDAEIQAQVKLSVWVRNAFGGRFGVLESDGVGTQEHVESCGVEAQGGTHCGAVGRNGVVCGQTEPFAWLQVGIETAFRPGTRAIETGRAQEAGGEALLERHHVFDTEIHGHCQHLELAGILGRPVELRKVLEVIAQRLELL